MLSWFRNAPLQAHLLFAALIVLLRLPGFFLEIPLPGEAQLLLTASKLQGGGRLYIDAWYEGPPVMVWIYTSLYNLFKTNTLTALRVLIVIYLYFAALYLHHLTVSFKVYRKDQYIFPVLFLLLVNSPWYSLEVSAHLLALIPLAAVMSRWVYQAPNQSREESGAMFAGGACLAAVFFLDYSHIFLVISMFIGYVVLRKFKTNEVLGLIAGAFSVLVFVLLYLHFRSILNAYLRVGLYQSLRNTFSSIPGADDGPAGIIRNFILNWSIIYALAVAGFVHYRLNLLNYVISARRVEQVMLFWLIGATALLLAATPRINLSDFTLLSVPAAFYASRAWYFRQALALRIVRVVLIGLLLFSVWVGAGKLYMPGIFGQHPDPQRIRNYGALGMPNDQEKELKAYFKGTQHPSVWVLAHRPGLYGYLDARCPLPYTDYRVAHRRIRYLADTEAFVIGQEADENIFKALGQSAPDYIIDPDGRFDGLKARFPLLLNAYQQQLVGRWIVWKRENRL